MSGTDEQEPDTTASRLGARVLPGRARAYAESSTFAWRLHLVTLVAGFLFLMWVNRNQWFAFDEWSMLLDRQLVGDAHRAGLLEPFNEHWTTLTLLIYRIQYRLFGLRSYYPYLFVLALFQTLSAHLLWRVMLRCGVLPLIAVVGSATYLVLGAGAEMLTNAYGITNVAPVACGFGAMLVVAKSGPFSRRDALGWVLLIAAIMFQSGAGVPFVAVVGAQVLFTRGIRPALAVVSVPAAVFAGWYLGYGADAPGFGRLTFIDGIKLVPEFIWTGLTAVVDETTGLVGIAPVLLVLVAFWLVRRSGTVSTGFVMAVSLAAGAILELALVTFGRGAFGAEVAESSRYLVILVPMLMPLFGLAATVGLANSRFRLVAIALVAALLLLVQTSALYDYASRAADTEQEQKRRIVAAAEILRVEPRAIWQTIVPDSAPVLDPSRLRRLDADGELPIGVAVSEEDRLTARTYFQVSVTPLPEYRQPMPSPLVDVSGAEVATSATPGCVDVHPTRRRPEILVEFSERSSIALRPDESARVELALARGDVTGRFRKVGVVGEAIQFVNVATSDVELIVVFGGVGDLEVCNVVPAIEEDAAS